MNHDVDLQLSLFEADTRLILTEKNMFLFCYAFKQKHGTFPHPRRVLSNFWTQRSIMFLRYYHAAKNLLEHETLSFSLEELSETILKNYIDAMMHEVYKVVSFDTNLERAYHAQKNR